MDRQKYIQRRIRICYDAARMKIYWVSTRCYYAFGALVSEEDSYKLKELSGVRWVLPDSYGDTGLEIEGEGVPSYLQPDNVTDFNDELNLPSAPSGHAVPARKVNNQELQTVLGLRQHESLPCAVRPFGYGSKKHRKWLF